MHKHSQKAKSFVVMAHYAGEPTAVRSFTLDAEASISEIFNRLWPESVLEPFAGSRFAPTPIRIEILPDERTIPIIEETDIFGRPKADAA